MPLPLILAGGMLAGALGRGLQGYFGSQGAKNAARIQSEGADRSRALLEKYYGQAQQAQQPYQQAGQQGLEAYTSQALGGGFNTAVPQYQRQQFDVQSDPGFQFRLQQGTNAINNRASANGSSLGGGVLKELSRYGQGLASDETQNAFNRYTQNQNFDYGALSDMYNRNVQQQGISAGALGNLAGMGQQAAGNMSSLATGLGQGLSNIEIQRANSQSQVPLARGKAFGDFFGGLASDAGNLSSLYGMGAFNPMQQMGGASSMVGQGGYSGQQFNQGGGGFNPYSRMS